MISNSLSSSVKKEFIFNIINRNNQKYSIELLLKANIIEINVKDNNELAKYQTFLELEDFYIINKYFKHFDSIEEIYDFIIGLEKLRNITTIEIEQNFVSLNISLPVISKKNQNPNIKIILSSFKLNKNEIINILNEKEKENKILKEKIDYLMKKLGCEGEFEIYKEVQKSYNTSLKFNIDTQNSKIIQSEMDLVPLFFGVKKRLNKSVRNLKLIYIGSRDGDSSYSFHTYCDGKENTVIFVKDRNGRKFGGFANQKWNCDKKWICDSNAFLFSLDYHECYFSKNNNTKGKNLYGEGSYGPLFGEGYDLYLSDNCLSKKSDSKQRSFDYKGKKMALCGSDNFFVEDYEVYQLRLFM